MVISISEFLVCFPMEDLYWLSILDLAWFVVEKAGLTHSVIKCEPLGHHICISYVNVGVLLLAWNIPFVVSYREDYCLVC